MLWLWAASLINMINELDKDFLRLACIVSKLSPDDSVKNGAILTSNDIIIGRAWNDFPGDTRIVLHPKDLKRERICHAEIRAVSKAAQFGFSTRGSTLYASWAACSNCSKYLIDFGIKRVVALKSTLDKSSDSWRESIELGLQMFQEHGVIYELCDEEIGAELFFRGEWIHV
jgi:deoxycytidylate deaminase